jgi:hypothetical protein
MATSKEYAYYIKGNKVAIVQRDWTFSGGQTLSQPGLNDLGAAGALFWKSPKETVADGLELQYVYSPQYSITASLAPQQNLFYLNGWTVKSGYLTFLRDIKPGSGGGGADWTASPYTAVANDEYIVVKNSERWNGLHKVKSAAADGTVQTYTLVNQSIISITGASDIDIAAESDDKVKITSNSGSDKWLGSVFSGVEYVWISGFGTSNNNGFWRVNSTDQSGVTEVNSELYVDYRYSFYQDLTATVTSLSEEVIDTTPDSTAQTDQSALIYQAYRDPCYLISDVNILNDENDELDIPRYLANAVVYYVKAKYAEDAGEIEMKEYFMREFRRITEKHQSSKQKGIRMIQGFSLLR